MSWRFEKKEEFEPKEVMVDEANNDSTLLASLQKRVKIVSSSAEMKRSPHKQKRERKKIKLLPPVYLYDSESFWESMSARKFKGSKIKDGG